MMKNASYSSCSRIRFSTLPTKWPRCSLPVGRSPVSIRFAAGGHLEGAVRGRGRRDGRGHLGAPCRPASLGRAVRCTHESRPSRGGCGVVVLGSAPVRAATSSRAARIRASRSSRWWSWPESIGSSPHAAPALQSTGARPDLTAGLPATAAATRAVAGPRRRVGLRARRRGRRRWSRAGRAGDGPVRPDDPGAVPAGVGSSPASTTRPCTRSSGTAASSAATRSAAGRAACCCTSARSTTGPRSGSTASSSAAHEGGHTPFRADITDALDRDWRAGRRRPRRGPADDLDPAARQAGLAASEPHDIWYHRTTGIWQPVWLGGGAGDRTSTGLRWTPDLAGACMLDAVRLAGRSATRLVRVAAAPCAGEVLAERRHARRPPSVRLRHRRCPAPAPAGAGEPAVDAGAPQPHRRRVALLAGDGRSIDEVDSYVGLRSVGVGGRPVPPQRPALLPAARCWSRATGRSRTSPPRTPRRCAREVELVKALGFNGVRIHQKVEDPRFLYWCDRLGLLVWGEMPSAYAFAPPPVERLTREWLEVVRRDRSHPCVVDLGAAQRELGRAGRRAATPAQRDAVARALPPDQGARPDPAGDLQRRLGAHRQRHRRRARLRPHAASCCASATASPRPSTATLGDRRPAAPPAAARGRRDRGQPVMLTEFGGISLRPEPARTWYGYGAVGSRGRVLERLRRAGRRAAATARRSPASATPSSPTPSRSATACWPPTGLRSWTRSGSARSSGGRHGPCRRRRSRPVERLRCDGGRAEHVPLAGQTSRDDDRPADRQRADGAPGLLEPRPAHRHAHHGRTQDRRGAPHAGHAGLPQRTRLPRARRTDRSAGSTTPGRPARSGSAARSTARSPTPSMRSVR